MAGGGWKRVDELGVGDRLAIARQLPEPAQPEVWPDSHVVLLGQLIGDGSFLNNAPLRYTTSSEANSAAVATAAREGFGCEVKRYATNDLFWDRVVAIEPAGEEDVYDLTVPGPSSWLLDGVVSHNSGAIEQDSDLVLFLWREKERGSDDQDTEGEVINLKLAKHRNGPTGEIQLWFKKRQTRFVSYAGERYAEAS
jgi:replicative DNA helicase